MRIHIARKTCLIACDLQQIQNSQDSPVLFFCSVSSWALFTYATMRIHEAVLFGQIHPTELGITVQGCLLPSESCLAIAHADRKLCIYEIASGRAVATADGHVTAVVGLAFDRAGNTLVSGSSDGCILAWAVPETLTASSPSLQQVRAHSAAQGKPPLSLGE